ncbi:hypothetical protein [Singulisphaera sp. PoT]|uniref:hypothetical protein n=1 Tax=Singulisphaera sp. PoT TaxID=3411797 RepID=UPI003BF481DA
MRPRMRTLAFVGAALTVTLFLSETNKAQAQLVVSTPGTTVGIGVPGVGLYPSYGYGVLPGYAPAYGYAPVVPAYPVVRPYSVYRPAYGYGGFGYGPRPYGPYRGWYGGRGARWW